MKFSITVKPHVSSSMPSLIRLNVLRLRRVMSSRVFTFLNGIFHERLLYSVSLVLGIYVFKLKAEHGLKLKAAQPVSAASDLTLASRCLSMTSQPGCHINLRSLVILTQLLLWLLLLCFHSKRHNDFLEAGGQTKEKTN